MIRLFARPSGAQDFDLGGLALQPTEWGLIRRAASRLLRARRLGAAASVLEEWPFELREATNCFGDDFNVLWMSAKIERYVELEEKLAVESARDDFKHIADTIHEVGHTVRFVAVGIDRRPVVEPVASPALKYSSEVVEQALRDAERLLADRGAPSGVDRVHTALHGYLRDECNSASIDLDGDPGVAGTFAQLRKVHPALAPLANAAPHTAKIAQAMAMIAGVLDPIRNHESLAHPNSAILDAPEAMLVINAVRTLLHYLDARIDLDRRARGIRTARP